MLRYVLIFFLLSTITASAQTLMQLNKRVICTDAAFMTKAIKEEYGEIPYAMSLTESNGFLLVMRNPQKGTVSIIEISPDNIGCLIAAGKDFQELN